MVTCRKQNGYYEMRSFWAGEVLLGIGQYLPRLLANKTGMQSFYTEISCWMQDEWQHQTLLHQTHSHYQKDSYL